MAHPNQELDLVLNISKPIGWTSFDVVRFIQKKTAKAKVGHAGTLDPFADGVLLLCLGKATKRIASLMLEEKEYRATIHFGIETDTLDISGEITAEKGDKISRQKIRAILPGFIGEIEQRPPSFSALRIKGQRAYELARRRRHLKLEPRTVQIFDIALVDFLYPLATVKIVCSKGTYIRSLARDIAYKLNTVAFLRKLTRLRVGQYCLQDSLNLREDYSLNSRAH